jgi:glycosyltransferase involved in cell wall biosynthesis
MNNKDKLISIIVPIYKVEKYLKKCIESILKQTYKNIEIILVDDGSPDNCGEICDDYKQMDKRIKVIHKNNGGLSEARNYGIREARGDYLLFVDSDDFIAENICEILINNINKYSADMAICNFYYVFENKKAIKNEMSSKKDAQVLEKENIIREYFLNYSVDLNVAWNKLYKKDIFKGKNAILFPVGKLHEDTYIMYKIYYNLNRLVRINEPLYYYRQRNDSIISSFSIKNVEDIIGYIKDYYIFSKNVDEDLKQMIQIECIKQYIGCIRRSMKANIFNDVKYLIYDMRNIIINNTEKIFNNKYASFKIKKYYLLIKLKIEIYYLKR